MQFILCNIPIKPADRPVTVIRHDYLWLMLLLNESEIQSFPTILKILDPIDSLWLKALPYSLPGWLSDYFLKYLIIKHL